MRSRIPFGVGALSLGGIRSVPAIIGVRELFMQLFGRDIPGDMALLCMRPELKTINLFSITFGTEESSHLFLENGLVTVNPFFNNCSGCHSRNYILSIMSGINRW